MKNNSVPPWKEGREIFERQKMVSPFLENVIFELAISDVQSWCDEQFEINIVTVAAKRIRKKSDKTDQAVPR